MLKKGHGFIADVITPDNYIFGSGQLLSKIIRPDGNWSAFLPQSEIQLRNGLETMNCTVYGTLNAIEILYKAQFNKDENFSERFIGVLAETSKNGNSPHKVAEVIRKKGLIDDGWLPFRDEINEWDEYYSPKPMIYTELGEKWLKMNEFGHDWVFTEGTVKSKQEKLLEALKHSPVGASVFAWPDPKKGLYSKNKNDEDNHWITIFNAEEGEYWEIFDHYDDIKKKLVWNYDFSFAKRYSLSKKNENEASWWSYWWNIILDLDRKHG